MKRLSYPIIQLPLAITEDGGQLTFFPFQIVPVWNHCEWRH